MREQEEWRPIKGFEDRYRISNHGNVETLTREVIEHRRTYIRKGKILNKYYGPEGYYKVKLYRGDATFKSMNVHRLVCETFLDNSNDYLEINHKDGNPSNNYVENLEWCSKEQNVKHAYDTGLKKLENYTGEGNACSKLTTDQVLAIREEYSTGTTSLNKLAKKYDVVMGNIHSIVKRNTWKHV
jgi:hypothetical protein